MDLRTAPALPGSDGALVRLVESALQEARLIEAAAYSHVLRERGGPGAAPAPELLVALAGHVALPVREGGDWEGWLLGMAEEPGLRLTAPLAALFFVHGVLWQGWSVHRLDAVKRLIRSSFPDETADRGLRELLSELVELGSRGQGPGEQVLALRAPAPGRSSVADLRSKLDQLLQLAETTKFKNADCKRAWKRVTRERLEPVRDALSKGVDTAALRRVAADLEVEGLLKGLGVEGTYLAQMAKRAREVRELVLQLADASQAARGAERSDDERRQQLQALVGAAVANPRWGAITRLVLEPMPRRHDEVGS